MREPPVREPPGAPSEPRQPGPTEPLLIEHGTVVTDAGSLPADVLVRDGRVVALLAPGTSGSVREGLGADDGLRRIDATGKLVIPGGVDAHTHLEMPLGALRSSDTFETGTTAAAWGGTTTVVDFAVQPRGDSPLVGLAEWQARAAEHAAVDYGFHMILSDVSDRALADLEQLVGEGVTSIKVFMAYPGRLYADDGQILAAMQAAARTGMVCMVHAENGIAIDLLVAQAIERGETAPPAHATTRPPALEGEAVHRAIALARIACCPLYLVHLSTREAVSQVRRARHAGQPVVGETCPQYLFLDQSLLEGPDGRDFVCSPPLRTERHRRALWRGLARRDLSVVATDHCPFCRADRALVGATDFSRIPNGLPGLEYRLNLLYQGVVRGTITLERWVELVSSAPARLCGLWPRKGSLLPGADADIVVYDPARTTVLGARSHHMAVDSSPYEGMVLEGGVDTVLSRGVPLVSGDRFVGRAGHGRFLVRDPVDLAHWRR